MRKRVDKTISEWQITWHRNYAVGYFNKLLFIVGCPLSLAATQGSSLLCLQLSQNTHSPPKVSPSPALHTALFLPWLKDEKEKSLQSMSASVLVVSRFFCCLLSFLEMALNSCIPNIICAWWCVTVFKDVLKALSQDRDKHQAGEMRWTALDSDLRCKQTDGCWFSSSSINILYEGSSSFSMKALNHGINCNDGFQGKLAPLSALDFWKLPPCKQSRSCKVFK